MAGAILRKYGVATTVPFEVYEVDGVDLRTDWTPANADCEISKDEGDYVAVTATAAAEDGTYSIALSETEMQAARIMLKIVDAATKVLLDRVIVIETYGNASAEHAFDLDTATQSVAVASMNADVITAAAHDESTAFPLKSADTGSTQIARTGADSDTLETLSDEIAVVDATADAIKTKTDMITSGSITVSALVSDTGDVTIRQYDDYDANTTKLEWTNSSGTWAGGDLTSATISLKVQPKAGGTVTTYDGAVDTATGTQQVSIDMTSAETGALSTVGQVYNYHLRAEISGSQETLAFGDWNVADSIFTS